MFVCMRQRCEANAKEEEIESVKDQDKTESGSIDISQVSAGFLESGTHNDICVLISHTLSVFVMPCLLTTYAID